MSEKKNMFNENAIKRHSTQKPNFKSQKQPNENCETIQQRSQTMPYMSLYEPYWDLNRCNIELTENKLIKQKLRINQKNFEDAYVSDVDDTNCDIYIEGVIDRNRALNGDIVMVKLKDMWEWKIIESSKEIIVTIYTDFINKNGIQVNAKEKNIKINAKNGRVDKRETLKDLMSFEIYTNNEFLRLLDENSFQKTGKVVFIAEKKNSRMAAGYLRLFPDRNPQYALFSPKDSRMPRMRIPMSECPQDFLTNAQLYEQTLFISAFDEIPLNSKYADGHLKCIIGEKGDLNAETDALLIENSIDFREYSQIVNLDECLPPMPWCIPQSEFSYRLDLRKTCIFTIDPETARDLDDALHVTRLSDDVYEVGVHIADVSYFIREDSPIDRVARERTTSVYLVQKVIPMLPRLFCENLCSLNPGEDRLAFTVVWKINSNGDIIEEKFSRSVINSVTKLSYDHAQKFIMNPDDALNPDEFPQVRASFTLEKIRESVVLLNRIAKKLREKRLISGSLTLNQTKISFIMNKENNLPFGYRVYELKDSNKLVEEFMLLANIAVAHRIYDRYHDKAILRRHPPPNALQIKQVNELVKEYGYDLDISSSNSIQTFLNDMQQNAITTEAKVSLSTFVHLIAKTMQLAQYFCSGTVNRENPVEYFYHYGLAVPIYTHFTSPIRRYPDILVHRLLAASLDYDQPLENWDLFYLKSICDNCNEKKYTARVCSERSAEMFFSMLIKNIGQLEEKAIVISVKDHSFDVFIDKLGVVKRIYCDKLNIIEKSLQFDNSNKLKPTLRFKWNKTHTCDEELVDKIELFHEIHVSISNVNDSDSLKYNVTLMHPHEIAKYEQKTSRVENLQVKQDLYQQQIDTDPNFID